MDYERIHKVQMGVVSPTKLRMKLLGARNNRKEEGGSNSSRASPSKHEDLKNAKNSLLSQDLDEEANSNDWKGTSFPQAITSSEASMLEYSKEFPVYGHGNQAQSSRKDLPTKEKADNICNRNQNAAKGAYQIQPGGNLSTVHPVRSQEEDGNGSGHENGSTSSFEFHRGERTLQNQMVGPFFRHVPSKWNDAEKWIVNRQMIKQNLMKRTLWNQGTRQVIPNCGRIPSESMTTDQKHYVNLVGETKMVYSTNSSSQNLAEKFSFEPHSFQENPLAANGTSVGSRLQKESNHKEERVSEAPTVETIVNPTIHSVSMRDAGTEMTPIPSQDPSRTGTPIGATTPSFSPMSSMPSTPKRGAPVPSPADGETECRDKRFKTDASERDMQIKTRREIAALGLQLGKMNIVSWASQADAEPTTPSHKTLEADQLVKAEYVARAAAWEDTEKSKHTARYKREELKIQAWEGHLEAKFQAQMREAEVQAERMLARAQDKMAQKLTLVRQRVEEKIAAAEARRNHRAAKTAQQVERIRQTGHVRSHFRCCNWFL